MEDNAQGEALEQGLQKIIEQQREIAAQVQQLLEMRDRKNDEARSLRVLAAELRTKRNEASQRAQTAGAKARKARTLVEGKRRELQDLELELRESRGNLSSDRDWLERRLKKMEWEMMTTPTKDMLDREEGMVKEIRLLTRSLEAYKKVEALEQRHLELRAKLAVEELKHGDLVSEFERLRNESDSNHERALETSNKIDIVQKEADALHRKAVEGREGLRNLQRERVELQKSLRRFAQTTQQQRTEKLRSAAVEKIREKLARKERLTFEEYKLLSEAGRKDKEPEKQQ